MQYRIYINININLERERQSQIYQVIKGIKSSY